MKKQLIIDGNEIEIDLLQVTETYVHFKIEGTEYKYLSHAFSDGLNLFKNEKNGEQFLAFKNIINGKNKIFCLGQEYEVEEKANLKRMARNQVKGKDCYVSPMPGKIFKLLVNIGSKIKKDQSLIILEAMKMEHSIKAHADGEVEKIFFKEGDLVEEGVELIKINAIGS